MLNDQEQCDRSLEATKSFHRYCEQYDWIDDPRGLSRAYHRVRAADTARVVRRYWCGERTLDVGTGTGLIARDLSSENCVGLDINPWAVRRAREHCPDLGLLVADAESIPLKECSFSVVVCTEVLEHSPRPARIVSEMVRVLAPGGVLVGSVPSRNPLWQMRRVLSSRRDDLEPAHGSYSRRELQAMLRPLEVLELKLIACGMVIVFAARKPAGATTDRYQPHRTGSDGR